MLSVVVNAEQTTRADDDERPALRGIVPSINTFIPDIGKKQDIIISTNVQKIFVVPFSLISGNLSRIPWIPHLKYSYQTDFS